LNWEVHYPLRSFFLLVILLLVIVPLTGKPDLLTNLDYSKGSLGKFFLLCILHRACSKMKSATWGFSLKKS
jgi:hypothetical protein